MTNNTPVLLLTPCDAARALAISPRKLWAMRASGEIPFVRLGRSVRYHPDDSAVRRSEGAPGDFVRDGSRGSGVRRR